MLRRVKSLIVGWVWERFILSQAEAREIEERNEQWRREQGIEVPGRKYASIKRPKVYERLRSKGYSKTKAAKISNAMASKKGRRKKK